MTQRITVFVLYAALLLTVVWAGRAALGYGADYYLYSAFLAPWHRALQGYRVDGQPWPPFQNNHVEYMAELTRRVRAHTGFQPLAAGEGAFMYRHRKPGTRDQHLLVLGLPARMVVYGLERETARRLDRFADGGADLQAGAFRGRPGARPDHIVVTWSH